MRLDRTRWRRTSCQRAARREGATQVTTRGWLVDVASDVQAASAGAVYAAEVIDADRRGVVRLVLELTDPTLVEQFTPADVADRLTSMLGDRDQ